MRNGFINKINISNKTLMILAVVMFIVLSLLIIVFVFDRDTAGDYSLDDDDKKGGNSIQEQTSRSDLFYINYASDSRIKNKSSVQVRDTIKYQAIYANNSNSQVNYTISIHLSKGLNYVPQSSTVGEPIIKKNSDESSVLIYKRTLLGGVKENIEFSCLVNKDAKSSVAVSMTSEGDKSKKSTSKLTNDVSLFIVSYKTDLTGKITGSSEEKVGYGSKLKGVTIIPDAGFEVQGYICDKDVYLSNGKKIKSGKLIETKLLKEILVNNDLVLTVKYKTSNKHYEVSYEINGKVVETKEVIKGKTLVLKELSVDDCVVRNWDYNNKTYEAGEKVTINGDMTFTGKAKCLKNETDLSKINEKQANKSSKDRSKSTIKIIALSVGVLVICFVVFIIKRIKK